MSQEFHLDWMSRPYLEAAKGQTEAKSYPFHTRAPMLSQRGTIRNKPHQIKFTLLVTYHLITFQTLDYLLKHFS